MCPAMYLSQLALSLIPKSKDALFSMLPDMFLNLLAVLKIRADFHQTIIDLTI